MKRIIKLSSIILLLAAFSTTAKAQFKFSVGPDLGMVTNEGMGLTYGLSLGGEFGISDHIGITAIVGYSIVSADGEGTYSLMPYQAGFKYYFSDNEGGFYAHAQVGMTTFKASVKVFGQTYSSTTTNLSFAPGVGYMLNEHLDLGVRYHIVLPEEGGDALNWIGLRAAYVF